ncbi:ABC-2 type transport system ATP-binding protein [Micromonospora sp. M71_S20]|uniref:ABC transporter ATP-binding protein n=1 Tax=Micromonospora sp. M71_S20 TaxID=592872 RepID=UPI000EB3BC9A|nr:ABC transporter ATP-binding protein [Micromonospora sp. M71_S20]RLK23144.1 ABC-2 type transport system ATP-binding protein [Micromonospora sp. M71_S20]
MSNAIANLVATPTLGAVDPQAIDVADVHKSYGDVRAVNGIDLRIAPGEVVALLGPNGAGKSTLVDMILGLTRPDRGEIRVFGHTPREAITRGVIGATLQDGALLDDVSIRELLTMVASLHTAPLPIAEVLRRTDLTDVADRRSRLSGGQRQRLRLAMTLVSDPKLLVLDEPTVAMDVESRHVFWAAMREFTDSGRTVVFASHYMEEAEEFADRVVLVQAGKIIADGTVTEIRSVVAGRSLSATVPDATVEQLRLLPGVMTVEARGERVEIVSSDSDATARELFARFPQAYDVEIGALGLEQAFLALTATKGGAA